MAKPPAKCTRCGHVFPVAAISISNSVNITLSDLGTDCPRCGGPAFVGEGTFDAEGEELKLIKGPPETKAMLERL
jgi:DNA-directed RNA polymerase subunit RPC12/RpoP